MDGDRAPANTDYPELTECSTNPLLETSPLPSSDDDIPSDASDDDLMEDAVASPSSSLPSSTTKLKCPDPSQKTSFCDCHKKCEDKQCTCGEENNYFEWVWDERTKSAASYIKEDMREVMFHIDYSCGTAAVKGVMPMKNEQYFWEVKMTTPVYGTDMMVGVCSGDMDLNQYRHIFCSMIGHDSDSWGLSYSGQIQHKQQKQSYASKFGQGSIIGVHLDMWHGTLSFYKNRRPLGIAYRGLQGKTLYPIVSSTAARSGMKVICNSSFPTSLQFMCCQMLRKVIPQHLDVLKVVSLPPGLKDFLENNIRWLLQPCPPQSAPKEKSKKRTQDSCDWSDSDPSTSKRLCRYGRDGAQ